MYPAVTPQVLVPELYARLKRYFPGDVLVSSEGEPFRGAVVYDPERRRLVTQTITAGEYYRVNCPFCTDTKHRLWVNHMYGQPDATGRPMTYLAICYLTDCLTNRENWRTFDRYVRGFLNVSERGHSPFTVLEPRVDVTAPVAAEPPGPLLPLAGLAAIQPEHPAVRYMFSRGYTTDLLRRFEVCYCPSADAKYRPAARRVVFPVRDNHGDLVGWQARHIPGHSAEASSDRKYWFPAWFKKSKYLYNMRAAAKQPYVVVVEGVTDAHGLPDAAVATFGKSLSYVQKQLLLGTWHDRPIILLQDPEEFRTSCIIAAELGNDRRAPVIPLQLPEGVDPGQYIGTDTLRNFVHARCTEAGISLPVTRPA